MQITISWQCCEVCLPVERRKRGKLRKGAMFQPPRQPSLGWKYTKQKQPPSSSASSSPSGPLHDCIVLVVALINNIFLSRLFWRPASWPHGHTLHCHSYRAGRQDWKRKLKCSKALTHNDQISGRRGLSSSTLSPNLKKVATGGGHDRAMDWTRSELFTIASPTSIFRSKAWSTSNLTLESSDWDPLSKMSSTTKFWSWGRALTKTQRGRSSSPMEESPISVSQRRKAAIQVKDCGGRGDPPPIAAGE